MSKIDQYLQAATRDNTRQSYQAAVRHFEIDWGGFLPATADSIARYLADHAETHAVNTLKQRLSALAQWHIEQGFPDPTKAPVVRKVLRGIQALHPAQEKQAKPLQLEQLEHITSRLDEMVESARTEGNRVAELRHRRDKALLLLGFWRGFRGDELLRMRVEHIQIVSGEGLSCFLPQTKGDRSYQGITFKVPALSRLCPVQAYQGWIKAAFIQAGPVFRAIDRWGHVSERPMHIDSLIPVLRSTITLGGIESAILYSTHSMRRGFASWATANGWDMKKLMEYVGWKNVQSAMRYIESSDPFAKQKIERSLTGQKTHLISD
jgi:integrase